MSNRADDDAANLKKQTYLFSAVRLVLVVLLLLCLIDFLPYIIGHRHFDCSSLSDFGEVSIVQFFFGSAIYIAFNKNYYNTILSLYSTEPSPDVRVH